MKSLCAALFPLGLLIFSGCVANNRWALADAPPTINPAAHPTTVAVAGVDDREYLRNKEVPPHYAGLFRSGFGIPYRVHTRNGAPLSDNLADATSKGLDIAGYHSQFVANPQVESRTAAVAALKNTQAKRLLLLTVKRWESESMVRTEIDYALVLEVFDGSGTLLATRELTGLPMISGWAFPFTEIYTAHKRVREQSAAILTDLINTPPISAKL